MLPRRAQPLSWAVVHSLLKRTRTQLRPHSWAPCLLCQHTPCWSEGSWQQTQRPPASSTIESQPPICHKQQQQLQRASNAARAGVERAPRGPGADAPAAHHIGCGTQLAAPGVRVEFVKDQSGRAAFAPTRIHVAPLEEVWSMHKTTRLTSAPNA
jgi:hypothetical protein